MDLHLVYFYFCVCKGEGHERNQKPNITRMKLYLWVSQMINTLRLTPKGLRRIKKKQMKASNFVK